MSAKTTAPETSLNEDAPDTEREQDAELVEDELLVEEISIDGMCGVY
jgi:mycofactocin precursor